MQQRRKSKQQCAEQCQTMAKVAMAVEYMLNGGQTMKHGILICPPSVLAD